jgi:two-component system, cell cycle sensor histidine kinase and response regulator CckA
MRLFVLFVMACAALSSADGIHDVLLVNSYHQGYRWSDDAMRGISQSFAAAGVHVKLHVEYLDSKRHPQVMSDPSLLAFMHAKYDGTSFDLLITIDDNATWFIMRERDRLFPGVPLAFCGVNELQPERLVGRRNITGVNESADIGETLDCMLRLHPRTTRILVVTDLTETGGGVRRALDRWRVGCPATVDVKLIDQVSRAEMLDAVAGARDGTLILYTFFFQDRDGATFDYDDSAALVAARAHVPVYTTWDFNQGYGMVGGKLTSGIRQGEAVAEQGLRILAGTPPSDVPIRYDSPNRWCFEYAALQRYGIPLSRLPYGSQLIGEPDTAYSRYRNIIWLLLAVLAGMAGIIAVLAWNIRRRRCAELALRQSEESLATTLYSIAEAVIATDADGLVTRLNPVAEVLTGWRQDDAVGKPLEQIFATIDAQTREARACPVGRVLHGETVVSSSDHTLLVARDGSERVIVQSTAPIRDRQGHIAGVVLVFRDQTAEKRAAQQLHESETRLRQHEKLGAIGQLAGGVAHDFNNQLTGILGFAELLAARIRDPQQVRSLDHIIQAALRSAELTKQLLSFARKGKVLSVPVRLHEVIHQVVALLSHSIDKRIRIVTFLEAQPDTVQGDPGQLQNALLNLALNARDAMPTGGELRFSTCITAENPSEIVLSVGDTGSGMDDETKRHLFEPFFTTKDPGKGTGLGLAAVYGAIQSHGGAIAVDSAIGRGTVFTLRLPLHHVKAEVQVEPVPAMQIGHASILVVDDEDAVRHLLKEMLEGLGYRVSTCVDGIEAVERFRTDWRDIDLVILDLVMPRLGGSEVFAAMREIDPDLRVLLSSGFSLDGEAQAMLATGACGFIQKPFRSADLARQVTEILRGS